MISSEKCDIARPDPVAFSVDARASYALAANVENLRLVGTASLSGTGNELDNVIIGNAADNALYGMDGNDTLIGNAGYDEKWKIAA